MWPHISCSHRRYQTSLFSLVESDVQMFFHLGTISLGRCEHCNHTKPIVDLTAVPRPFKKVVSARSQANSEVVCLWWKPRTDLNTSHTLQNQVCFKNRMSKINSCYQTAGELIYIWPGLTQQRTFSINISPQTQLTNEHSERSLVAFSDAFWFTWFVSCINRNWTQEKMQQLIPLIQTRANKV